MSVNEIALELVQLKHKCMTQGLYKTGQALEAAVKAVGWELADTMDKDRMSMAEAYYKRNKKRVDDMIQFETDTFSIFPGDSVPIHDWDVANWRWFIRKWKAK